MKKKYYLELKKSITIMRNQRSDVERNKPIEEGKRIGTDEIIKENDRIKNNL